MKYLYVLEGAVSNYTFDGDDTGTVAFSSSAVTVVVAETNLNVMGPQGPVVPIQVDVVSGSAAAAALVRRTKLVAEAVAGAL